MKIKQFALIFFMIGSMSLLLFVAMSGLQKYRQKKEIQTEQLSENEMIQQIREERQKEREEAFKASIEETQVNEVKNDLSQDVRDLMLSNRESMYELPISNSMGISLAKTVIKGAPEIGAETVQSVDYGEVFLIKEEVEQGEWLKIELENRKTGYIESRYTLINLPDIVPSIIYNITNSYNSVFKSSQIDIPNITGQAFYNSKHYNERLGNEEFVVPVLYPMAKKIKNAQELALEDGNTLVVYDTYRPYDLQMMVYENLLEMSKNDALIKEGMTQGPWHIGWFIASGVSSHQQGAAMDVSLAKIKDIEVKDMGGYQYLDIVEYEEYRMQSKIHELSVASVSLKEGINWKDSMAWKEVEVSDSMTVESLKLREYCSMSGLEPIASEWWHFNDLDAINEANGINVKHSIKLQKCISKGIE